MKNGFIVGSIFGAVLGLGVALSMDLLLGEGAGGSWSSAVARDLGAERGSLAVNAGVVGVVLVLGLIGALVGGLAGAVVGRFVTFLNKAP